MNATVVAVCRSADHTLSKHEEASIRLLTGRGVEGDAHAGETVKHRSRVRVDPTQPNLRQVHLLPRELHDELAERGLPVVPGQMGENVLTAGIDLLSLPRHTILHLGPDTRVELTGLRNPCTQLDSIHEGLMHAVLERDAEGRLVRKAGVMGVVRAGGEVRPGDRIEVDLPPPPSLGLERV